MDQSAEFLERSAKGTFRWTSQMFEDLVLSINNFKSSMDQKRKYFYGDRTPQYGTLRTEMAQRYDREYLGWKI